MRFVEATIEDITLERRGLQKVNLRRAPQDDPERAYVLTDLIGPVVVGDRVVMNTTAVDLALGTGGWHFVHWNLSRSDWQAHGGGHVMKLRYTSIQMNTGVMEEASAFSTADDLAAMPVIACLLHSQIAPVAVACKALWPEGRIAYVMTDQAALPIALSDLVAELGDKHVVDLTITAGQAFGGDYEAVNTVSAMHLARHPGNADITIVAEGPGVVGTGTTLGFSGLEMASVIDQVHRSKGLPILTLRWSRADPRARHQGLSHHSLTVLDRALASATVGIPKGSEPLVQERHHVHEVEVPDLPELCERHNITMTSMGRGMADDPEFFSYAAAAGVVAVQHARFRQ